MIPYHKKSDVFSLTSIEKVYALRVEGNYLKDKERAFILNKDFRRVADNVPDDAHTLL